MPEHRGSHRGVSTGVPPLDQVLGGLYWGDNVVWLVDGASPEPFYREILRLEDAFDATWWVGVTGRPSPLVSEFPGLESLGTAPGRAPLRPGDLLRRIRARCETGKRNLLIFESLDGMVHAWGPEVASGFFARCCPMLLDMGAVSYWSGNLRTLPAAVQETVEAVPQCIVCLDRHSMRVAKAEGRDEHATGALLHWRRDEEHPVLSDAEANDRVAASLRALRRARRLSQQQLAQIAGVTSSAISQAERAERGLSLATLLRLSSALGLSLDALLDGHAPAPYRVGRRPGDPHGAPEPATTLVGDLSSDVRVDLVHLGPRERGAPRAGHDGDAIVAVARGLVEIRVGEQTPAIRGGEVLLADSARVTGWRNLAEREAVLFWIVRTPGSGRAP